MRPLMSAPNTERTERSTRQGSHWFVLGFTVERQFVEGIAVCAGDVGRLVSTTYIPRGGMILNENDSISYALSIPDFDVSVEIH